MKLIKEILFRQLIIIVMSYASLAQASIDSDMHQFFDKLGVSNNISAAKIYRNQQAGYYTGGSVFARNRVRNLHLANIQFPSYRAGCGGIDLYTGGFSFINDEQFVAAAKNILNNAVAYSFSLALETVSPMVSNVMTKLQEKADAINFSNINSCEEAAGLVGSFWPRTAVAQKHICQDVGTNSSVGLFSDWAQARQQCGAGNQLSTSLSQGKSDKRYQTQIIDGNIMWKILKRHPEFRGDRALSELIMSLSGTVIIDNHSVSQNTGPSLKTYPSLIVNQQLMAALLYGGEMIVYHCHDTKNDDCLNLDVRKLSVNANNGFVQRNLALLGSIAQKILNDDDLNKQELHLLANTSVPIYKILLIQLAAKKSTDRIDLLFYAEILATDSLIAYLRESLRVLEEGMHDFDYSEALLTQFKVAINSAKTQLTQLQNDIYAKFNLRERMIKESQFLSHTVSGKLSRRMNYAMHWARSFHP